MSPDHWKILSALASAGVTTGVFEKKWTHPASPQFSTTKPFSSIFRSRTGAYRSRTESNSSSEAYIMGMCSA